MVCTCVCVCMCGGLFCGVKNGLSGAAAAVMGDVALSLSICSYWQDRQNFRLCFDCIYCILNEGLFLLELCDIQKILLVL